MISALIVTSCFLALLLFPLTATISLAANLEEKQFLKVKVRLFRVKLFELFFQNADGRIAYSGTKSGVVGADDFNAGDVDLCAAFTLKDLSCVVALPCSAVNSSLFALCNVLPNFFDKVSVRTFYSKDAKVSAGLKVETNLLKIVAALTAGGM